MQALSLTATQRTEKAAPDAVNRAPGADPVLRVHGKRPHLQEFRPTEGGRAAPGLFWLHPMQRAPSRATRASNTRNSAEAPADRHGCGIRRRASYPIAASTQPMTADAASDATDAAAALWMTESEGRFRASDATGDWREAYAASPCPGPPASRRATIALACGLSGAPYTINGDCTSRPT